MSKSAHHYGFRIRSAIQACGLIAFLFLGIDLRAQSLNYKNYTIQQGISSNFLYSLLQDNKGFIWIASESGLSSFDGTTFVNFTTENGMPDNEVLKLYEDKQGRLWFLTLKGLIGFIHNGKIDKQTQLNKEIGDAVVAISEDCEGNLLVACSKKGLLRINKGKIIAHHQIKSPDPRYQESHIFNHGLHTDCETGRIITFTYGAELIDVSRDGSIREYENPLPSDALLRSFPFPNSVMVYAPAATGKIKFDRGLVRVDQNMNRTVLVEAKELGTSIRLAILQDNRGDLWVGTLNGLIQLKKINGKYRFMNRYLPGIRVSSLLQDIEGNIWAGSLGDGLFIFPSNTIYSYTTQNGLKSNAITVLAAKNENRVYAGTDNGYVNILSGDKITVLNDPTAALGENDGYNRVTAFLFAKDSTFWVAKDAGLLGYRNEKLKHYFYAGAIKSIVERPDGRLWIGSHAGIGNSIIQTKNSIAFDTAIGDIGRTAAMFQDGNVLWFWTEKGLGSYDRGIIKQQAVDSKLFAERIACIQKDKLGDLWMASQGQGLIRKMGNKFQVISAKMGMASNICNSLFLEGDTVIWVATNSGLSKVTFLSLDKKKYKIQNITMRHGLASDKVTSVTKTGHMIYAGTDKGLSFFDERDINPNNIPPPIYITGVKIWSKDTTIQQEYELNYQSNNIEIVYAGLSFRSLGSIVYKYKMEGIDTAWRYTNYTSASFPVLPPGKYTFSVKCVNEDGTESSVPATVSFIVGRPYWQNWWFYVSASLLCIGVTAMAFTGRIRRIEERNKLRQLALEEERKALRAQMNPHFIFNALNSIQYFILNKNILRANEYLSKFASLIRRILDNSEHASISIYDEVETVRLYIEIEAQRFDSSFEYEIEIEADVDKYNIEIPPMIIQPYVENAIWHGLLHRPTKGKLTIHIFKGVKSVICAIQDNGIGRKRSQEIAQKKNTKTHVSVGMEITESRLSNISQIQRSNYSVTIHDLVDDQTNESLGTRVELIFPELN